MNSFWVRASDKNALQTIVSVLKIELDNEIQRKSKELAKFAALEDNPDALIQYKRNSGLTADICSRILSEVIRDKMMAEANDGGERNAVYGERELGALFNEEGKAKWDREGELIMSFQDELNRVTKTPEDVLSEREKESYANGVNSAQTSYEKIKEVQQQESESRARNLRILLRNFFNS